MGEGGRWAIYSRLSVGKEDGGSHSLQVRDCRRFVSGIGGTIVLEEADDESGLVRTRPGYQRLLAAAGRGEIDGVVVWRFDRLGRSLGELASRTEEFEARGIRVVSATEGDNPTTRDIMFALARDESRRTSTRVYPRQLEVARAGRMTPRPPWGYRLEIDPESPDPLHPRRRLVVYEPEAALYRETCRRFLDGASLPALSRWLFARGHRAYWTTVRARLENPIYAGTLRWNRRRQSKFRGRGRNPEAEHVIVPESAPAIVDAETHRRVQAELARRRHGYGFETPRAWALTGIIHCACGKRMYGVDTGKVARGERASYSYRCTTKFGPEPCPFPQIGGARLEWALAEAILHPLSPDAIAAAVIASRRVAATTRDPGDRRRELEKRADLLRRRASALIDRLLDGTLTPEAYKDKAAEIESERATLVIPERQPAPPPIDLVALRRLLEAGIPLEDLSVEDRRRLFRATVARVDWDGSGMTATWTGGFSLLKDEPGRRIALPKRRQTGGYLDWLAQATPRN